MPPRDPLVLVSFDAEEFDLPGEYGQVVPEAEQLAVGGAGLVRVLDLLDRVNISATFFVTAHFAAHQVALVERIARRHEMASHGWRHGAFEDADLARSKELLERLSGQVVVGFRRARMGDTDPRALIAAGYRYDSSDNPTWVPGRYNHWGHPRRAHRAGPLVVVPASVTPVLRVPLFWLSFKNLPLPVFKAASAWTLRWDGYLNLYFHPWELADLSGYRIPGYVKRVDGERMAERLERYLTWLSRRARFGTIRDFAARV